MILDRRATTGVVALNRPAALNAVNRGMVRTLGGAPELWRHDDTVEAGGALSVGWVERCETYLLLFGTAKAHDGFRCAQPILRHWRSAMAIEAGS